MLPILSTLIVSFKVVLNGSGVLGCQGEQLIYPLCMTLTQLDDDPFNDDPQKAVALQRLSELQHWSLNDPRGPGHCRAPEALNAWAGPSRGLCFDSNLNRQNAVATADGGTLQAQPGTARTGTSANQPLIIPNDSQKMYSPSRPARGDQAVMQSFLSILNFSNSASYGFKHS